MKTDARVRYTVHMIQNVFLELLKEKPVAKITVKEICGHAEINRSTFYKHYQDVYDLMEKLENEAVEAFEKLLDSYVQNETVPALVTLLTSLRENRELLLPLPDGSDPVLRFHGNLQIEAFCSLRISDSRSYLRSLPI